MIHFQYLLIQALVGLGCRIAFTKLLFHHAPIKTPFKDAGKIDFGVRTICRHINRRLVQKPAIENSAISTAIAKHIVDSTRKLPQFHIGMMSAYLML